MYTVDGASAREREMVFRTDGNGEGRKGNDGKNVSKVGNGRGEEIERGRV